MPFLKNTAANIKGLLKQIFGVQEEHPMIANFGGDHCLSDLIYRVKDIYNNKYDALFK